MKKNIALRLEVAEKGFTLVEVLVSLVIFMLIMIAVYSLFDGGQWFYLHAERRTKIQEIARMAMEQLERDLRMIGFGIPQSSIFGGSTKWTPEIFVSTPGKIYFRADLDNRHAMLTRNAASGDTTLYVEEPDLVCPAPGFSQIVLARDNRRWQPLICTGADNALDTITIDATPATGSESCDSEECEVYTPEHIFYRLTGDADNDGVCDSSGPGSDPFCSIERAVIFGNAPLSDDSTATFETLSTNIIEFKVENSGLLRVTITARDRSMEGPQKYQDVTLVTQILVRGDAY